MRKKILFIITKSVWGGAQRYVFDLASHLDDKAFDVAVAAGGHGPMAEKLEAAGVRYIEIASLERDVNTKKETQSFQSLWSLIQRERPDILHLNSSKVGGLGALAGYLLKLRCRLHNAHDERCTSPTIVFTVHGWAFNEDRSKIIKSVIRFLQWFTAWLSDYTIILSNRDYRQAIHFPFIPRKKFILIPLGIPTESIAFLSKRSARTRLGKIIGSPIGAKDIIIGTIAELTKNKGLPYLIEAIQHLRTTYADTSIRVCVIGDGEDKEALEARIRGAGLETVVHLTGFVVDAASYIKGFDYFVLPSLKEGLPYTLLEAMHAGSPIVASRVGGIPDLIEHETNGLLVPPKNASALALALHTMLLDEQMKHRFIEAGKQKIKTKFSFETMVNHTVALYHHHE
jgi:glycosyltransferase involved in cell wall biosynthesis